MTNQEILKEVFSKFGRQILTDKKKLYSILQDYNNKNTYFKSPIFTVCLENDFVSHILNINENNANVVSNNLVDNLVNKGFDKEKSQETLNLFLFACNVSYQIPKEIKIETQKPVPIVQEKKVPIANNQSHISTKSQRNTSFRKKSTMSLKGRYSKTIRGSQSFSELLLNIWNVIHIDIFCELIPALLIVFYTLFAWFDFSFAGFISLLSSIPGITFTIILSSIILFIAAFIIWDNFDFDEFTGFKIFLIVIGTIIISVSVAIGILALGWYLNSLLYPLPTTILMIFPLVIGYLGFLINFFVSDFKIELEPKLSIQFTSKPIHLLISFLLSSITPIVVIVCHHVLH